ncbi:MAG: DUF2652 domain-containing protein [Chloroflexota bacterium]
MAEKGFLILADITGYTQYLNKSELEHAQDIITSLINAILKPIHPPIIVHRIEGDAVFAYTTQNAFLQGQSLLESLEQLYFGFAHELENNDRNTTCECNACQNMHLLNLKTVVHFGEFGLQDIGNHQELIGNDVNTVHRLLKNKIIEKTGIQSYLFISQASMSEMSLEDFSKILTPHSEIYENIGTIDGFVYDLAPIWQRERERIRVFISKEDAKASVGLTLPIPPPIAWDYFTNPTTRAVFRKYDNNPVIGIQNGRLDVGTTYHCAHGEKETPETIVDWKPFNYVTAKGRSPILNFIIEYEFTTIFEAVPDGTNITVNYSDIRVDKPTLLSKIVVPIFIKILMFGMVPQARKWSESLHQMIAEDKASGKLKMKFISAQADINPF